jgi:N-acetylmuramoyl-L-alanine amidase
VTAGRGALALVVALAIAGCSHTAAAPRRATATSQPAPAASTTSPAPATTAGVPLAAVAGKVIVLDPGHNGGNARHPEIVNRQVDVITEHKPCDNTGTQTNDGYAESAYAFDVATRMRSLLQAAGATVVMTRPNDTGVGPCVDERAFIGNRAHAAVAVSIHADGGPAGGRGFHVIEPALIAGHTEPIVEPSRRLGSDLRADYAAMTGMPPSTYTATDGIVVRSDLGGLNWSTVPKVFIETGNMRNATDAALLESAAFRQRVAAALCQALADFLSGK